MESITDFLGGGWKKELGKEKKNKCMRCEEETDNQSLVGDEVYSLCDVCRDDLINKK